MGKGNVMKGCLIAFAGLVVACLRDGHGDTVGAKPCTELHRSAASPYSQRAPRESTG